MNRVVLTLALIAAVHANAKQSSKDLLVATMLGLRQQASDWLSNNHVLFNPDPENPYWNVFPTFISPLMAGKLEPVHWSSPCFSTNQAWAKYSDDKSKIAVTILSFGNDTMKSSILGCTDTYSLASASIHQFAEVSTSKLHSTVTTEFVVEIDQMSTNAELWDLDVKGLRLFRHMDSVGRVLSNLIVTIDLFKSNLVGCGDCVQEKALNKDMMEKYTHTHVFNPIEPGSLKPPDASLVHSGDFFGILGFDGMGSMMSWAMGSTTSHTTVALWINGELNVCESTGDGVQCNPYQFFLNRYAGNQVVWVPMSQASNARFNETAAFEYFKTVDGLEYGFQTLLWTWLDTETDNFPCIAPDFSSRCFIAEWAEIFIMHMDRAVPEIGNLIWNQGFAKRLGVAESMRTVELLQIGHNQGYPRWTQLAAMPEQDSWQYNTTRFGQAAVGTAMTCCVFVCNIWKAGGVFDKEIADNFNCVEMSNWDDYVLTVLAPNYTQINGNWSLVLNDYNSKSPYAHMAETCTGKNPDYVKDPHC